MSDWDCRPTIDAGTYPERVFFYWLDVWRKEWEIQKEQINRRRYDDLFDRLKRMH